VPDAPSCNFRTICNVLGALISTCPGTIPHKFVINTAEGNKFYLQAENEDEMIKWIWALRRCANGGLEINIKKKTPAGGAENEVDNLNPVVKAGDGVRVEAVGTLEDAGIQEKNSENSSNNNNSNNNNSNNNNNNNNNNIFIGGVLGTGSTIRHVRPGPAGQRLLEFTASSADCAECSSPHIKWISSNLGITLCEDCATAHRQQLSWAVSKLKNITLDDFYDWQVDLLINEMGNAKAKKIWEVSIPEGWKKPNHHSGVDLKAE